MYPLFVIPKQMTVYKATVDNTVKTITAIISVLFLFILVSQFNLLKDAGTPFHVVSTIGLIFIYGICYLLRPMAYELTNDNLIIHRPWKDVKIATQEIQSLTCISKATLSGSIRTFGVGGLFGYFGKFYQSKIGKMTWYATRTDRPVLIITKTGKKIIITPDDPQKLADDFNQLNQTT